jgi:hypothetical protein
MDLENVLAELRKERDAVAAAILSFERLNNIGMPGALRSPDSVARKPKTVANGGSRNLSPDEKG